MAGERVVIQGRWLIMRCVRRELQEGGRRRCCAGGSCLLHIGCRDGAWDRALLRPDCTKSSKRRADADLRMRQCKSISSRHPAV